MANKILVTGATGTIGKALINTLKSRGSEFIAGVTSLERGKKILGDDIPLVEFNYENQSGFNAATAGVTKVFLLGPPLRNDLDQLLIPFIEHLKQKGITRVVYVAALGLDLVPELPFHTRVIDTLARLGFTYTILKPSFFSQNFKSYEYENIMERGVIFVPAGNGKAAFVDVHDIALVAATVLTEEGHDQKTYDLTGPELLSYTDAAELLSEQLDKKIMYPNPTPEVYANGLKQAGAPDFIAPYMIAVYSMIADNKVAVLSDDIERITGRKPGSLRAVLERDFQMELHSGRL